MKSKDQRRPGHSLKKRFHDDTQDSLYTHEIFIEVQFNKKEDDIEGDSHNEQSELR